MKMEATTSTGNSSRNNVRVEDLHLDRVVASSPEIGPAPPDGGYGWAILVASVVYNVTVPSILVTYGTIIMYTNSLEDYEEGTSFQMWDSRIALVPVFYVVFRLLLEPWCRAVITLFHMPRVMALSGVCMSVAGVMLSSFTTANNEDNSEDIIINIFAGIFAGAGAALTGQQSEVILKHYFRDRLELVQTIYRVGPSIGNCIFPLLIAILCTSFGTDYAIIVYGGILLQCCLFLALFTRPIYITKPLIQNYKILNVTEEDDDEEIFNKGCDQRKESKQPSQYTEIQTTGEQEPDNDEHVIATFNSRATIRERIEPSVQVSTNNENRFSSDFSVSDRFSSDFSASNFDSALGRERQDNLNTIEQYVEQPEPLYRETTVRNPDSDYNFMFDQTISGGTARRTAHFQRNFFSIIAMFFDMEFYLYTILHLTVTFSVVTVSVLYPPFISQQQPNMDSWHVGILVTVTYISSLCFIMLCIWLPKSIHKKTKLCIFFSLIGMTGFYGISASSNRSFLSIWGLFANFSTSAIYVLQQPLYETTQNLFDALATTTASNILSAALVLLTTLTHSFEYKTMFQITAIMHAATAVIFIAMALKNRLK